MFLSFHPLQVKAFTPTNNTAACAAVAAANTAARAAAASHKNANKELERDKDEKPGIVKIAFDVITLLFFSTTLFICMVLLAGLFLGKDDGI